jgi:hypothetical protein
LQCAGHRSPELFGGRPGGALHRRNRHAGAVAQGQDRGARPRCVRREGVRQRLAGGRCKSQGHGDWPAMREECARDQEDARAGEDLLFERDRGKPEPKKALAAQTRAPIAEEMRLFREGVVRHDLDRRDPGARDTVCKISPQVE